MIRINVVCIGKIKDRYIKEGIAEFSKRLSKYIKLDITELAEEDDNKGIENAINSMIPLSQTMEEQIKGIREWAKIRAKKAGSIEWETENVAVRQLEI